MRKPLLFPALCSALLLAGAVAQAATQPSGRKSGSPTSGGTSSRTYKWVDSSGVTHYGDSIPPEYAQGSRSELNSQGVEVRKLPAQLSPQEAAVAEKNEADISKRRQHDTFLLNTYVSAKDIEQLRDERITLIDSQLDIARGSMESVDGRVKAISTRMGAFKPYSKSPTARRLPDPLAEEAVRVLQERRSLDETIAARQQEMQDLRKQFDADLARYRELTANRLPR